MASFDGSTPLIVSKPVGDGWVFYCGTNLGQAMVSLLVNKINHPPVIDGQSNLTIVELTPVIVTNNASDSDLPPEVLTFSLVSPPTGMTINTNTGLINWTPTEAQGPGVYTIRTRVTDSGVLPLSATNTFTITVTESHSPIALPPQLDRTMAELTTLRATNTAVDPDLPANPITYGLAGRSASGQLHGDRQPDHF